MNDNVSSNKREMKQEFRNDEDRVRGQVDQIMLQSVEQTLNGLLEAEADALCGDERY